MGSLAAPLAARQRLSNNVPLNDFWQANFGRAAQHLVGYEKPKAVSQLPTVCYVPVNAKRNLVASGTQVFSVVVTLHNQDVSTDGVFAGLAQLDAVEDLIIAALQPLMIAPGIIVGAEFRIEHTAPPRHPIYEMEIIVSATVKP
ncbi:MAG: hypothetical protein EPN21_05100 [Methylococcaceae bacterium]|nr:MAG: hypothetical protein EPN21_05100 [Methylococcaceae bacterium]